jgi:hypothetical protein
MDSQLSKFLRRSPYQRSNILKYQAGALLPEGNCMNHIEIQKNTANLASFISYSHYQGEQPVVFQEKKCYFCPTLSKSDRQHDSCGECRKVVCRECEKKCGKCAKILCQFDTTYDYAAECDCCFHC